jgi:hypothetical protein
MEGRLTVFFFQRTVGHCGGGWLIHICTNHPTKRIAVLGESQKASGFDLEARGLSRADHPGEINRFLEDRVHFGDDCGGAVKCFFGVNERYAQHLVGKQNVRHTFVVRNPMYKILGKWKAKRSGGRRRFEEIHGRPPENDEEVFAGTLMYFRDTFYVKALRMASLKQSRLMRLEDVNRSIRARSPFFRRYMRVVKVVNTQREETWWANRNNWEDDPDPARCWVTHLDDRQREIYKEIIGPIESEYGYNQTATGSVETDWACRNKWWGEVE